MVSEKKNGETPDEETPSGVILIRVCPRRSYLNLVDVDPHFVPMVLRTLADSFEEKHCGPGGRMEDHKHPEEALAE